MPTTLLSISMSRKGNEMDKTALKEELVKTILNTINAMGNVKNAARDVFADHNVAFDEKLFEEAHFEALQKWDEFREEIRKNYNQKRRR